MSLGDNIRALRLQHGYKQADLAQALTITQGAVSQWERGTTYPDIPQLVSLAQRFGVSVDFLLSAVQPAAAPLKHDLLFPLYQRPALRLLLTAASDLPDDVLQKAAALLLTFKERP